MWKYINGHNLNGAHNSLIDVKAQTDIIINKMFVSFINRSASIQTLDAIFSAAQQIDWRKELEPEGPVHSPWVELKKENNFEWTPPEVDSYTGFARGPLVGPTTYVQGIAMQTQDLSSIFLAILPLTFFSKVAELTNKYCFKDWVVEKKALDSDGNPKKRPYLETVPTLTDGEPTPGRPHRADREQDKWRITPGFIICWVAILILQGAHFGSDKKLLRNMWRRSPYGISMPYIQNTMMRDAFEFLRQYIHFSENYQRPKSSDANFDPLFKVSYVLEEVGSGIHRVWQAGKDVSLDESMIKYCGRAVAFIQYMPAKPIKHGIKVFCLCCAATAVMLAFEVYCGKDNNKTNNTMVDICERLIHKAGLVNSQTGGIIHGRTIYSDNYYTSVKMAKHLYKKYRWTLVGTVVPTEKTSRSDEDLPFVKLSNGARNKFRRGWFSKAYMKKNLPRSKKAYYMQCTTWKDKKQVMFLATNQVGFSQGLTVQRHVKGKKSVKPFNNPMPMQIMFDQ